MVKSMYAANVEEQSEVSLCLPSDKITRYYLPAFHQLILGLQFSTCLSPPKDCMVLLCININWLFFCRFNRQHNRSICCMILLGMDLDAYSTEMAILLQGIKNDTQDTIVKVSRMTSRMPQYGNSECMVLLLYSFRSFIKNQCKLKGYNNFSKSATAIVCAFPTFV